MSAEENPTLARRLGTATLTLYGVGVIVGAGIYVLVGEVAAEVGHGVWIAFLAAAIAAVQTGLSYASLSSRFPHSAGEAVFVRHASARPWLAFVVGYLVLASGVSSTAAVSHGFASYLGTLLPLAGWAPPFVIIAFLAALSWVNHRGMTESMWVNGVCTVVSLGALLILVVWAAPLVSSVPLTTIDPPSGGGGLLAGTALAFYAFIGFEDICNVAEEVKTPERAVPRAIMFALVLVSVVYVLVGMTVVAVVPPAELAASDVPLVLVAERLMPSWPNGWLSAVALLAVSNTALFNLIMGSRILYGMSRQGWVPRALGKVDAKCRTPTLSVWIVFALAVVAALTGFLRVLAEATNVIILTVFFAVNAALIGVRLRKVPGEKPTSFEIPIAVPVLGVLITGYLVTQFSAGAYVRAALLAASGAILFALARRSASGSREEPS